MKDQIIWWALYRKRNEGITREGQGSNFEENIRLMDLFDGTKLYHVGLMP